MTGTIDKLREFLIAHPVLEDGESMCAATKAMPEGGVRKFAKDRSSTFIGGAVGAWIAHARDKKIVAEDLATAMRNGVYLMVTERRLMLISAGGMRGLPQEHLASVDRSRIERVERGETRVSLIKMGTATLHLDDGSHLGFEFPKLDAKDAEHLLQVLGG